MAAAKSNEPSDIVRFGGGFILVCVTLIAVFAIAMLIADVAHHRAVKSWPHVQGTVTRSVVNDVRGKNGAKGSRRFEAQIGFDYEVDGVAIKGTNNRDTAPTTKSDAAAIIAEHPVGQTVAVYYDPDDPRKVTLDNDPPLVSGTTFGYAIPAFGYLVYFAGWLVPAIFRKRRTAAAKLPKESA